MDRSLLIAVAAGSALAGGVVSGLTVWALASPAPANARGAASAEARSRSGDPALAGRLAAVEQRLRLLELRRELASRAAPAGSASPGAASGGDPSEPPPLIDDPVFEAAVRDIIDRSEEDRVGERQARREERRRAEVQRWTERLAPRLTLSDAQKAKLAQIATDYWSQARTLWDGDGGAPPPREQRLAQVRAAREQADAAIRQALDPRQAAEYDKLEDELRLGARRFGRGGTAQ